MNRHNIAFLLATCLISLFAVSVKKQSSNRNTTLQKPGLSNTKLKGVVNMRKILILAMISVFILLMVTGCVPGDGSYTEKPAGFFSGIWHGWIAPISLILGLFKKNIRVYEVLNTGWWYDLGFYIAVISGFGGLSLSRKKKSKEKKD